MDENEERLLKINFLYKFFMGMTTINILDSKNK